MERKTTFSNTGTGFFAVMGAPTQLDDANQTCRFLVAFHFDVGNKEQRQVAEKLAQDEASKKAVAEARGGHHGRAAFVLEGRGRAVCALPEAQWEGNLDGDTKA